MLQQLMQLITEHTRFIFRHSNPPCLPLRRFLVFAVQMSWGFTCCWDEVSQRRLSPIVTAKVAIQFA